MPPLDVPVFAARLLPDGNWEIIGRDWDNADVKRLLIVPSPPSSEPECDLWIIELKIAA